jgi:hypothetical protein
MRTVTVLLLLFLTVSARAREWKSALFHCSANVPEATGWQNIEATPTQGLAVLLVMQHPGKRAVFGINVVEKLRDANLADPAIQKELEAMLRQFGYQFAGHSNVTEGGLGWLQYPVVSGVGPQQVKGVIRFASAGGYVFGITMLKGGGQDASQDVELQQAAKSFRVIPSTMLAATPAPDKSAETPAADDEQPSGDDDFRRRMIWYGGGGLIVLLVFFSIIGGGRSKKG